jgi:RAT1-interacting protein
MNVMFVNGVMYFEEHLSEVRLQEKYIYPPYIFPQHLFISYIDSRNDMEPHHRIQTYYGYAFESYCTSDGHTRQTKPEEPAGWGGDVDTNVQWCSVVRTKLGNIRLVIGGEVDCVRGQC